MSKTFEHPRQTGSGVSQGATSKQQDIQYLTDLMATISAAYYKKGLFGPPEGEENLDPGFGRRGRLWLHETSEAGVSIDLYDLFGDNLPMCEHLEFDDQTHQEGMPARQQAYCISYNPDWEEHPVLVLCNEAGVKETDDSFDLSLEDIPAETVASIIQWIESLLPSNDNDNK